MGSRGGVEDALDRVGGQRLVGGRVDEHHREVYAECIGASFDKRLAGDLELQTYSVAHGERGCLASLKVLAYSWFPIPVLALEACPKGCPLRRTAVSSCRDAESGSMES